jgi:hypothetical protein
MKMQSHDQSLEAFIPHLMFFYGTLSLPHILESILHLSFTPIIKPARIRGYCIKMWGPCPALMKATADDTLTYRMAYEITEEKDLWRLKQYEGENYELVPCSVQFVGGCATAGWTYLWNGYPEELEEGVFQLWLPNVVNTCWIQSYK